MRFLLMTTLLTILSGVGSAFAVAQIPWENDLERARVRGRETGKMLLLHFYDDQCVWCQQVARGAHLDPQLSRSIADRYIPVKVHGPSNPAWVQAFRVNAYPTDLIVTAEGVVVARHHSPQDPLQYLAILDRPQSQTQAQTQTQTTPQSPSVVRAVGAAAPNLMAGLEDPAAMQSLGVSPRAASYADSSPAMNRSANRNDASAAKEKTPLLDGFCPVTMIDREAWVPGSKQWGVIHLGELYYFASAEAQGKFLREPHRYAPMLNGIDVVLLLEERRIVPGLRNYGWTDPQHGRIYLFASEETAARFNDHWEDYSRRAHEIMERVVREQHVR